MSQPILPRLMQENAAGPMPGTRRADSWAIVLAGGEGIRLRPLVHRVLGEERPKQYVPLLSERTLLGQTLDRVGIGIPLGQIIVVTMERHAEYTAQEFGTAPHPHLLAQPEDRGTAAAILTPIFHIARKDPAATIAVFPSDHYIPSDALFMACVAEVKAWVDANPDWMVLLGAKAMSPEVEYGWIEPGESIGEVTTGPVRTVRQFWEKPSRSRAERCLAADHLWNTSVVIAKARTFVRAGRQGAPELMDALLEAETLTPLMSRAEALRRAYARMPKANFSRAVLETCPHVLGVARLPALAWSDLGSPRRVMEVIASLDTRPAWATGLNA